MAVSQFWIRPRILFTLERIAVAMEECAAEGRRIADHVAPASSDIIDGPHVAKQLGCTTVWGGRDGSEGCNSQELHRAGHRQR